MFSGQHLRELVKERLAAAAEIHRIDFPRQTVFKEEEVLPEQQLWNQKRNCVLEQEGPEPPQVKEEQQELELPQVKEEQEELCISQKGEQLVVKLEADILCENETDFPQQSDCKEEEVLAEQQLWNQERNSVLEQEGPEPPQVKEEQEELCISQKGEQLVVKLEADTLCENETGAPQLHDCKKEEILTVQQLCKGERNSSLDQEEQKAAQVKEEEELCTKSSPMPVTPPARILEVESHTALDPGRLKPGDAPLSVLASSCSQRSSCDQGGSAGLE
ncbi:uncharacterized protein KZ484_015022 [Pholidichthys leucotaenia]